MRIINAAKYIIIIIIIIEYIVKSTNRYSTLCSRSFIPVCNAMSSWNPLCINLIMFISRGSFLLQRNESDKWWQHLVIVSQKQFITFTLGGGGGGNKPFRTISISS